MRVYWLSARGRPYARGVRRMPDAPRIRPILKRGALVTAANWQLVAIQSAAEVAFQVLLAVPVAGGALLVGAVAGGDVSQLVGGGLWPVIVSTAAALTATPVALAAFLAAFAVVLLGGSLLMFVIKAGTVAILAEAETAAGPVERPPLRWSIVSRAGRFDINRFLDGAGRLGRRYAGLGLALWPSTPRRARCTWRWPCGPTTRRATPARSSAGRSRRRSRRSGSSAGSRSSTWCTP